MVAVIVTACFDSLSTCTLLRPSPPPLHELAALFPAFFSDADKDGELDSLPDDRHEEVVPPPAGAMAPNTGFQCCLNSQLAYITTLRENGWVCETSASYVQASNN
jgi:hypothetical protein